MKLIIKFPKNLVTEQLILQERIPCLCKVSASFEVVFREPLPEVSGTITNWDRKELELRALAGGGGRYTHYACGAITLRKAGPDSYDVVGLEMFYENFGWCPILINGDYAPPGDFWDEE